MKEGISCTFERGVLSLHVMSTLKGIGIGGKVVQDCEEQR